MGLLRDIQADIETRMLRTGGWPFERGGRPAIETTCYALMALAEAQGRARRKAIDVLLKTQNRDGSWPAFEGDDPEGCWTTALALIAFRCSSLSGEPVDKALRWLVHNKGREGHWFWKWKFRTVDRAVQFNPDKYGWSWFPGTVSWVIPTALSVVALKQALRCCRTEQITARIQLGTEMLRDRSCPQGGWNAGNGVVFGAALTPHIDATSIGLLALTDNADGTAAHGLSGYGKPQSDVRLRIVLRGVGAGFLDASRTRSPSLHEETGCSSFFKGLSVQCRNPQPRRDRDERS